MSHSLHEIGYSRARVAIKSGKVSAEPWNAPGEGERDADDCLGDAKSYPVMKGGTVYRRGVAAAHSRAAQQGDTEIADAAGRLMKLLDDHKMKMGGDDTEALYLGNVPLADFSEALTLSSSFVHPKERDGKPCFYFWKESLPADKDFYDAKGRRWHFSTADVDAAVSTLKLAREKGHEPSAPSSHKDDGKNYGYIVDARRNAKGNLELLHQFKGEDARDEALTKKSSICILPRAHLEDGTPVRNLIDHNAIVSRPQIGSLEGFKPALAASGQATRAVVLELAAPTQEPEMDLKQLRKLVGAAENATDEQVITAAETKLGELSTASANVTKLTTEKVQLSRDLEATKLELSRADGPAKPTARELHYASRAAKQAREQCIKAGALTPAIADKIEKRFMPGKQVDADKLTLSREVEEGDHMLLSGFDRVTDVFESLIGNEPSPKPGEQTKAQFSRHEIGGEDDADGKKAEEDGRKQGEAYRKEQLKARGIKE